MARQFTLPNSDRIEHLRAAWARASSAFVIDARPPPRSADDVATDARAWLIDVFGEAEVPFALPPDLVWWIEEVAKFGWSDNPDDPWRTLYCGPAIVRASEEARWVSDPPVNRTAWLAIGAWSDRHHWLVCCDPHDPRFGLVFDYNDTHPWMSEHARPDREPKDMLRFMMGFIPEGPEGEE